MLFLVFEGLEVFEDYEMDYLFCSSIENLCLIKGMVLEMYCIEIGYIIFFLVNFDFGKIKKFF